MNIKRDEVNHIHDDHYDTNEIEGGKGDKQRDLVSLLVHGHECRGAQQGKDGGGNVEMRRRELFFSNSMF